MHLSEDRPPSTRHELFSRSGGPEFPSGIIESFAPSKYDLASRISHGLRTPLTSVLGFTEVLREDNNLSPEQRAEFTAVIRLELRRLIRFVGLLNDFVDIQTNGVELENTEDNVLTTLRDAVTEYSEEAKHRSVGLHIEGSPQIMLADHRRLGSAVQHLIANALDATPEGGSIMLKVETDGRQSLIRVADTGRGIPEHERSKVFEPFYRIPRPNDCGSELGLGLSVAHSIVRMHGGSIEVSTREGRGTEMRIEIPRS